MLILEIHISLKIENRNSGKATGGHASQILSSPVEAGKHLATIFCIAASRLAILFAGINHGSAKGP